MNDDIMTYEVMTNIPLMMMSMVMLSLVSLVTPSIVNTIKTQQYQGRTVSKTLYADSQLKWLDILHDEHPYIPWICAYIINQGPGDVEIAINYPGQRFIMKKNETITVTRSGAQERIAIIFYQCVDSRGTSVLRVTGEY